MRGTSVLETVKAKIRKEYKVRIKKMSIEDIKIETWRQQGMKLGNNVHIYSEIYSKEPYMISIDDDTTISGDVTLVTHDNSISKYLSQYTDVFGKISIGKKCFIGMGSMIMPGVTLADNTIVAAGSVVTKSILEPGNVVGGVPAKIIGRVSELKEKNEKYGIDIRGMSLREKREYLMSQEERLIKR